MYTNGSLLRRGVVTVGSRHMTVPVYRQVSTGSPRSVPAGWYGPHAAPELLLRRFLCSAHTVKLACSLRSGPVAGDRTAFEKMLPSHRSYLGRQARVTLIYVLCSITGECVVFYCT